LVDPLGFVAQQVGGTDVRPDAPLVGQTARPRRAVCCSPRHRGSCRPEVLPVSRSTLTGAAAYYGPPAAAAGRSGDRGVEACDERSDAGTARSHAQRLAAAATDGAVIVLRLNIDNILEPRMIVLVLALPFALV